MGLILYRCDDDFPPRIPALLAEMDPPVVCEGGAEFGADLDPAFRYYITRGKARVMICVTRKNVLVFCAKCFGKNINSGSRSRS